MNFATQVSVDTARCLAVALVAVAIGWPLGRGRLDRRSWVALLAPLLTPPLLISYAAAPIALALTVSRPWLLTFYSALVVLKLWPIAAIARQLLPSPLTPESRHCLQLLPPLPPLARLRFTLRSLGAAPWLAVAFIFLCAFADFELASLLSCKTWTVMLFDAHAGGLVITESIRRSLFPVGVEVAVLIPAILLLSRSPSLGATVAPTDAPRRWPALVLAGLISGLPAARLLWLAATGIPQLGVQEIFGADLVTSLGVSLASAGTAWLWVLALHRPLSRVAVVLPGLLGGMVLALCILSLSNPARPTVFGFGPPPELWRMVSEFLRNTPASLLVAEVLLLMPVAVLVRTLFRARRPAEALHLARMAGSRRLIFDLALWPHFVAFALLFLLAYFEFTAATILAPIGLTPVFARLHNLAHYGQTAVLSAMLLAAFLAPAAVLALTLGVGRLYARRDGR